MKSKFLTTISLLFLFVACSESPESLLDLSNNSSIEKSLDTISSNSILSDFFDHVSNQNFHKAILLIHPKLKDAWTEKKIIQDLKSIRSSVEHWEPEITGTFAGKTHQGPYKQASYKLESKWNSLSSMELISMGKDSAEFIVKITVRIPHKNISDEPTMEITEQFIQLMFDEEYQAVESLMSPKCQQQFPSKVLKNLKPILGKNQSELNKRYYRLLTNAVWYHAARLNTKNDAFTFMELIVSDKNQNTKIEAISFRGVPK